VRRDTLDRLLAAWEAKQAHALVTELASGDEWLLPADAAGAPDPALVAVVRDALARDACQTLAAGERTYFVQPFSPPLRLVIVGAVHIAQPLAAMAALAEYAVTVVDPRQAFASEARFPDVAISTDWPDEALGRLGPDARTAVVTLTHDPKLDDAALRVALRSPAFYVGSLGSQKTHAARLRRLRAEGFGEAELARIHAPVGLDIGARSPAEIAVSVLAEITLALRGAKR
jgi:xanthine dehydrogenase accessory factor